MPVIADSFGGLLRGNGEDESLAMLHMGRRVGDTIAERVGHVYDATPIAMTQFGPCSFSVAFQNGYKFTGKARDARIFPRLLRRKALRINDGRFMIT